MYNAINSVKLKMLGAMFLIMGISMAFDLPNGWIIAGSKPGSYNMGIDPGAGMNGSNAATIQSNQKNIKGFGTLMQMVNPQQFLGKRVRMSAMVKSMDVKEWAGLWLRVDQSGTNIPLAFDNMANRPIKGNTTWTKFEIVLDVSKEASGLAFGALLAGTGKIWFDELKFDTVSQSVPVTGKSSPAPINTDFDH